jgi:hypothetical protein
MERSGHVVYNKGNTAYFADVVLPKNKNSGWMKARHNGGRG